MSANIPDPVAEAVNGPMNVTVVDADGRSRELVRDPNFYPDLIKNYDLKSTGTLPNFVSALAHVGEFPSDRPMRVVTAVRADGKRESGISPEDAIISGVESPLLSDGLATSTLDFLRTKIHSIQIPETPFAPSADDPDLRQQSVRHTWHVQKETLLGIFGQVEKTKQDLFDLYKDEARAASPDGRAESSLFIRDPSSHEEPTPMQTQYAADLEALNIAALPTIKAAIGSVGQELQAANAVVA